MKLNNSTSLKPLYIQVMDAIKKYLSEVHTVSAASCRLSRSFVKCSALAE
jgi:hypothetical protein